MKGNLASIWPMPLQLSWKEELGDWGKQNNIDDTRLTFLTKNHVFKTKTNDVLFQIGDENITEKAKLCYFKPRLY